MARKRKTAKSEAPARRKKNATAISGKSPRRGRVENLRPFLPGTSGNPSGRPKTAALSQACRDKLADLVPDDPHGRTYAQCIADRLGELAIAGNLSAAQELADRAEGRARQTLAATVTPAPAHPYETESDQDVQARRDRILATLGYTLTPLPESELVSGSNGASNGDGATETL